MSDNSNVQESTIGVVSINGEGEWLERATTIPFFDLGLSTIQAEDLVSSGKEGFTFAVGSVCSGKLTFLKNFMMHNEASSQQLKSVTNPDFIASALDSINSIHLHHFQSELRTCEDFDEAIEAKEQNLPFFSTIHADSPINAINRLYKRFGTKSLTQLFDNDLPFRFVCLKLHSLVASNNSIPLSEAILIQDFKDLILMLNFETLGPIVKKNLDSIRVNLPVKPLARNEQSVVSEVMIVDSKLRNIIMAGDIDSLNYHYKNEHRFNSDFTSSGIPMSEIAFSKVLNGQFCANEYAKRIMPYDVLEENLRELKKLDPTNALFGTLE